MKEFSEIFDEAEKNNDRRPGDSHQKSYFKQAHTECQKVDHA